MKNKKQKGDGKENFLPCHHAKTVHLQKTGLVLMSLTNYAG